MECNAQSFSFERKSADERIVVLANMGPDHSFSLDSAFVNALTEEPVKGKALNVPSKTVVILKEIQ